MTLQGKGVGRTLLPAYFYDLNAITDENRSRWTDQYSEFAEHIYQPGKDDNLAYMKARMARNVAYSKWLASFSSRDPVTKEFIPYLKPGLMKFQAIRVIDSKDPVTGSRRMWWDPFRDCQFRVFINPQTFYDDATKEHVQYYLLCPEDGYLVNRYEVQKAGHSLPPREYDGREVYLSADKRLRRARLIAVANCTHLRNEGDEHKYIL